MRLPSAPGGPSNLAVHPGHVVGEGELSGDGEGSYPSKIGGFTMEKNGF